MEVKREGEVVVIRIASVSYHLLAEPGAALSILKLWWTWSAVSSMWNNVPLWKKTRFATVIELLRFWTFYFLVPGTSCDGCVTIRTRAAVSLLKKARRYGLRSVVWCWRQRHTVRCSAGNCCLTCGTWVCLRENEVLQESKDSWSL